jgi:hypothetical protein
MIAASQPNTASGFHAYLIESQRVRLCRTGVLFAAGPEPCSLVSFFEAERDSSQPFGNAIPDAMEFSQLSAAPAVTVRPKPRCHEVAAGLRHSRM